jgi:hypothetical protein
VCQKLWHGHFISLYFDMFLIFCVLQMLPRPRTDEISSSGEAAAAEQLHESVVPDLKS